MGGTSPGDIWGVDPTSLLILSCCPIASDQLIGRNKSPVSSPQSGAELWSRNHAEPRRQQKPLPCLTSPAPSCFPPYCFTDFLRELSFNKSPAWTPHFRGDWEIQSHKSSYVLGHFEDPVRVCMKYPLVPGTQDVLSKGTSLS